MTIARDLGYDAKEKDITQKELLKADECFFTGTAAEVAPIAKINNKTISKGRIGKITQEIKTAYIDAVHGKTKKYENWLTYVK
jgi:branched-chain amino acid aminotransferase